jgi:hypothetical protein
MCFEAYAEVCMSSEQLALVLLGAFWAGTSVIFSGMKSASEVRDKILLGKNNNDSIDIAHLRRLLLFDWFPLKFALAAISLVLGIIIVMLPGLANSGIPDQQFTLVCYVTASVPFLGALFFCVSTIVELRVLRQSIRLREQTAHKRR